MNHLGDLLQLWYALMQSTNFEEQNFVTFKYANGEKKANKTLPGTPETRETCSGYAQHLNVFFNQLRSNNQ